MRHKVDVAEVRGVLVRRLVHRVDANRHRRSRAAGECRCSPLVERTHHCNLDVTASVEILLQLVKQQRFSERTLRAVRGRSTGRHSRVCRVCTSASASARVGPNPRLKPAKRARGRIGERLV